MHYGVPLRLQAGYLPKRNGLCCMSSASPTFPLLIHIYFFAYIFFSSNYLSIILLSYHLYLIFFFQRRKCCSWYTSVAPTCCLLSATYQLSVGNATLFSATCFAAITRLTSMEYLGSNLTFSPPVHYLFVCLRPSNSRVVYFPAIMVNVTNYT